MWFSNLISVSCLTISNISDLDDKPHLYWPKAVPEEKFHQNQILPSGIYIYMIERRLMTDLVLVKIYIFCNLFDKSFLILNTAGNCSVLLELHILPMNLLLHG